MNNMEDQYHALELDIVKEQMLRFCSFSLGKQRIRQALPCFEKLWVDRELARVKEAFALVVRYGNLPFGGIRDISKAIDDALKDRILYAQQLREVADAIRASEHLQDYMKHSDVNCIHIKELIDSLSDHRSIATKIEGCISVNYEVLDNASPALKSIRKEIHRCNSSISSEVQRFIARHSSKLMDTITTTRNDRTCVLVKISEKNSIDGFVHGESASGQTAYVEPQSLLILNNKLQSLHSKEQEEINRILFMLSQEVKYVAHELAGNLDTYALLDSIFAKGLWAKDVNGCVATIDAQSQRLYLKDARHPLIDSKVVVSNTYEIKKPFHCLLITGSNTGGKTVTLKTIGLSVAMTMCGMPIKAEEGIIPLFDSIYADIGDHQSIQESLSTFSSHISQLAYICDHASAHSLVLLDELGSGTDPKEGEPLAVAILDELRALNAMVIATTHYSALKSYGAKNEDILLSSVAFDMEKLKPTYRYIEGLSGQSNAFEIARRYGLKDRVIAYAIERKERDRSEQDIALEQLEASLLENRQIKEVMEERLADIHQLQDALAKEKKSLEANKAMILQKTQDDARKALEQAKEEAQDIIEELKALKEDAKPHEIINLKSKLKALSLEDEDVEEEKKAAYAVGDYVNLKKLNYYGEILSINKEKVCVFTNGMKMNTTLKEIKHASRPTAKAKTRGYEKRAIASFSMEVNVIGMRVAEALPIIDKYLDNAILAKVYQVRVIHGMGTGALRKGVHDYLKRHPRVEQYQMGGQGEGGLGATVVTLKQKGKANG